MKESDLLGKKPWVYIDLDGVLADLFGHATNVNQVKHWLDLSKAQWDKYYRGVDAKEMFTILDPFPTTDAVIDLVVKKFGKYKILSRPLEFDEVGCIAGKNKWIDTHLKHKPEKRIFTPDKWKYAVQEDGTPNILIDDHRQNIHLWEAHGGIGIKWQADEDDLSSLKLALQKALDKFQ